jgi:hypothetical protein
MASCSEKGLLQKLKHIVEENRSIINGFDMNRSKEEASAVISAASPSRRP